MHSTKIEHPGTETLTSDEDEVAPMAKKKGSGSNLGLIITLVIFVLTTVILGVTTYMGYSQIEEKEKAQKKAENEAKVADADSKYHRLLYRLATAYIENKLPEGVDAAEVARDKAAFDKGQFSPASNQKDKEQTLKWSQSLATDLGGWNGETATGPATNLKAMLTKRDTTIADLRKKLKDAEDAKKASEDALVAKDDDIKKERDNAKAALDKVLADAAKDRAAYTASIDNMRKGVNLEGDTKEKLRLDLAKIQAELEAKNQDLGKLDKMLKELRKEHDRLTQKYNTTDNQLTRVLKETNFDLRKIEASELTIDAKDRLKSWNKRWEIVRIDGAGNTPYVNLGSADRVKPQLAFSIHSLTPDGRMNPTPKGTLEILRVVGPNLSQARITGVSDAKRDPILKGDRLFNATWDPDRKTRVAIAGLIDLDGDRTDGTAKFVRMLERQNMQVDAWIDASDEKAPRLRESATGIGIETEFVIVGGDLLGVGHPKASVADYVTAYKSAREGIDKQANNYAVKRVRFGDFLEMMGLRTARAAK